MEVENQKRVEGLGFFCKVSDRQHFKRIEDSISNKGYFTDRVLFDRVTVRLSDLALVISPDSLISYAVHVRPTRQGSTGNRGFKAESPVHLDISIEEIRNLVEPDVWEGLSRVFELSSYRPERDQWDAIWEAIKQLRPDLYDELRRLEQLRHDETFEFDELGKGVQLYFEKDAVGVALNIVGIPFGGVFAELSDGFQGGMSLIEEGVQNSVSPRIHSAM